MGVFGCGGLYGGCFVVWVVLEFVFGFFVVVDV